jgi:hypothetical protein
MFGFLQKEKKDTIVAIFDISSGGVGGAIVNMDPLPIILSSARVAINSEKINGFDDLARATEKALGAVAYHVHQDNVAIPEKIICTLASPWYVSETRIIQMDRAESFTFTKKLADELLNKELSALARNDFEIIENRVMQVLIDGKSYEYPIGLVGKSIEMNMVTALSPQIFLDTIREKLSHTYPHIPVSFASFTLSSYMAAAKAYVHTNSYILLDITGEITDLSVIENGVLKMSLSFPCGKNTLLRSISRDLACERRDVQEVLALYTTDSLEAKQRKNIAYAFTSAEELWTKSFLQVLKSLPEGIAVPDTVFLTTDAEMLSWCKGMIADRWMVATLGKSRLHICAKIYA